MNQSNKGKLCSGLELQNLAESAIVFANRDYENQNKKLEEVASKLSEFREIVKAVANIGVDFGYGEFQLDDNHIKTARLLLEKEDA